MCCSFWVISNSGTMENAVASLCICLSLLRSGTAESRVLTLESEVLLRTFPDFFTGHRRSEINFVSKKNNRSVSDLQ